MTAPKFKMRPYVISDAPSLARHANDWEVARFLDSDFPHPYTIDDAITWIELTGSYKPKRNIAIEVNGEVAGDLGIRLNMGIYRSSAEIGYWLGREHWGKGIMSTLLRQWVAYAFDAFSFHKLFAKVFEHNMRSVRVLENAGFSYETSLKKHVITEGKLRDMHYYSIFRH